MEAVGFDARDLECAAMSRLQIVRRFFTCIRGLPCWIEGSVNWKDSVYVNLLTLPSTRPTMTSLIRLMMLQTLADKHLAHVVM